MAIAKKNQLLGLDIGSDSIKLVEIDHSKKGRILHNFGTACLPPTAVVEGAIQDAEAVSSAIESLFRHLKPRHRNVAIALSGYPVIVKRIEVEDREEGLESAVQESAERHVPFDLEEVNLDYDVVPGPGAGETQSGTEPGPGRQVILAAARKDAVEDYVSVVQAAGLSPAVVDVDAFALQNALEISVPEPAGFYALVHVGAEELAVHAVHQGVPVLTRETSYGGNQITEAIMRRFDLSFEQAEKVKLGGRKLEEAQAALAEIFQSAVHEWIQEIRRALDFIAGTYPREIVEKIYLSGGSSRIRGLRRRLEAELGVPVEEINPFANLVIQEKRFDLDYLKYMAPQAVIAVGLALRSLGDK